MKHLKKLAWCFLATMFFLTSCQEDRSLSDWDKDSKESLISGAKEFFETTISEAVTRGTLIKDKSWSPGEVVPEWGEASIKRNEKYEYVFVPIFTQKQYVGRYRMIKKNGDRFSHVRVSQVLCIRKNADGVYSGTYLTLMPSKAYYNAHKNKVASEFMKGSNFYNNFSGRIAYNDIVSFKLLAVDKVDKGEVEWGFSRKTANNREDFNASYREVFKYTSIIEVAATRGDPIDLEDFYFYACKDCGRTLDKGETCYCKDDNSFPGGDDDNDPWEDDEEVWDPWPGDGESSGGGSPSGGGSSSGGSKLTSAQIQQILCDIYNGAFHPEGLKKAINDLSPAQEQFLISLANIAALYDVGGELETMKQDLVNYPSNSALYSKYNKLNNSERYIAGWTSKYNSGGERAYSSGEIRNSGFELKFYPTKNGEANALGLVKSNLVGHGIEAALEYLERRIVENTDKADDFLYDMHLYNAVNFMNNYCK